MALGSEVFVHGAPHLDVAPVRRVHDGKQARRSGCPIPVFVLAGADGLLNARARRWTSCSTRSRCSPAPSSSATSSTRVLSLLTRVASTCPGGECPCNPRIRMGHLRLVSGMSSSVTSFGCSRLGQRSCSPISGTGHRTLSTFPRSFCSATTSRS